MFERQKLPPGSITSRIAAKWGDDVLDEGYVVFPKRLLRCLPTVFGNKEGVKEMQVALAIADFLRPNLGRGPSVEFLAFTTGLPTDDLKKIMRSLKKKGLINYTGTEDELRVSNDGMREKILNATRDDDDAEEMEDNESPF